MSKILACIDGSVYSESVADHAGWAASRLGLPVELLRVLGRRSARSEDFSGSLVAGARRKLLEDLSRLDAERHKLEHQEAWLAVDDAKARVLAAGATEAAGVVRHGDLIETMDEREEDAELVLVGKRGEAADFATLHLGSNLERMVRATRRPMLIASRAFGPINRLVVAFDGGPSALKAVDALSRSPLWRGIETVLLAVGEETAALRGPLDAAAAQLKAGGPRVTARIEPGKPEEVIARAVEAENADLLVMGAYGHSRLRTLVIGSTTAELIRACKVPIAVYR
jgi:nucleotide-binding universal stress UspA family protein